jgi:hypothetical protein
VNIIGDIVIWLTLDKLHNTRVVLDRCLLPNEIDLVLKDDGVFELHDFYRGQMLVVLAAPALEGDAACTAIFVSSIPWLEVVLVIDAVDAVDGYDTLPAAGRRAFESDRRQPTSRDCEFERSASSSISVLARESVRFDWVRVSVVWRSCSSGGLSADSGE